MKQLLRRLMGGDFDEQRLGGPQVAHLPQA